MREKVEEVIGYSITKKFYDNPNKENETIIQLETDRKDVAAVLRNSYIRAKNEVNKETNKYKVGYRLIKDVSDFAGYEVLTSESREYYYTRIAIAMCRYKTENIYSFDIRYSEIRPIAGIFKHNK
jgi:hypothetical protein